MPERNANITYEILEHLGTISNWDSGWNRELNLISWNGGKPKYDIRDWSADHERMSKGITLHPWEMRNLVDLYLTNNSEKAVAAGRAKEAERRERREAYRQASSERYGRLEAAGEAPPFDEAEPEKPAAAAVPQSGQQAEPEPMTPETLPEQPAPDGNPLMEKEEEPAGGEPAAGKTDSGETDF